MFSYFDVLDINAEIGIISGNYTQEVMYDKLNMIYLEIPKLKKTKEELTSHLEWWMYIFQNLHNMTDIPSEIENDIIKNTFDRAEFASMPKGEQEKYHKNLKVYRDLVNSFDFAIKEGREMGLEKGREEGMVEGLSQGMIKTAITMINKFKLSAEEVATELDISLDELKKHLK